MKNVILILLFILNYTLSVKAQLVYESKRKLMYAPYANQGNTEKVNTIPDFSFAGYQRGGVQLPVVTPVLFLSPQAGDCRALIQQAIDEVSALPLNKHGHRGAIVLKSGLYKVEGSLVIRASGVVIRGEGNGIAGTILVAMQKTRHDFIIVQGEGTGYGVVPASGKKIRADLVPTGALTLEVGAGHAFSKGDAVIIQKTPNDRWIAELQMAQYGWTANDYKINYERTITGVTKTAITLDIPLVDPIEERYGGGKIFKSNIQGRISECGIENLRIESLYEHDEDEAHGWNAVVLERAVNCWVKNVIAKYFGYACVNISEMSAFNTVEDCAMIDPKSVTTGARKYSFNIEHNSTCNLFQRCVSWGGRHDYVTGARVPGPNVFLDCIAENTFADIGPHHRWATGLLFDNVSGGQIRVQNRKSMGSGHGWAGAQTLFWNCRSEKEDMKVESPPGAMNWSIGSVGVKQNGEGYWESWGTPVQPRSLYLKQLEQRLGKRAVKRITTDEQRQGSIGYRLKALAQRCVTEGQVVVISPR